MLYLYALPQTGIFAEPWLGPVVLAPFIGSFLGVVIARSVQGRGFIRGRSACEACGHGLGVAELVPLVSFAALRGRCRHCRAPIGWFHLRVELAALGVAIWAALVGQDALSIWVSCALGWGLLALGWIDARCMRLPDMLTLPLLLAGLAEAWVWEPEWLFNRALGAALGYSAFAGLAWVYRRLRGREGLGLGDAKLLAAGGAWVGAPFLPQVILVAALGALAWAFRRGLPDRRAKMPFGPFLAGAIWVVWLYSSLLNE